MKTNAPTLSLAGHVEAADKGILIPQPGKLVHLFLLLLCLWPLKSFTAEAGIRLLSYGFGTNGLFTLTVAGPAPRVCRFDVSEDLTQWRPAATNLLLGELVTFADPDSRILPKRFYRVLLLEEPPFAPGEVLFSFKFEANAAAVEDVLRAVPMNIIEEIVTAAMGVTGDPTVLHAQTALPVSEAVAALKAHPAIEFAEPNYLVTHAAVPNDPRFLDGSLWGMYGDTSSPANQYGSQAAEAWAQGYTGSQQVYVGIIDTGIQILHPDLAPNIWTNPFETGGNGIDDDHNGYVDDIHGWDFASNDDSVFDGSPIDNPPGSVDGHGTHVAGTIGATGGDGRGVAGVNWNVTMISAKFLNPQGDTANAIKAVDYFTDLKTRHGLNIVALNNSWGGGSYSRFLHEAIIRAAKANILFIAAAGNSGNDNDSSASYPSGYDTTQGTSAVTPAAYDGVVAVAAIDIAGALAEFEDSFGNRLGSSSYGARTVDLGAPGKGVLSTVPWLNYGFKQGTSMATPHVTGAAALYASTHPGATAAQIRAALLNSVIPTPSLVGKCMAGGRLDLSAVIASPPQPTGVLYVDRAYTGANPDGSAQRPFPTVTQAHAAAVDGYVLRIRANSYPERPLLTKQVTLEALGGAVHIGL